MKGIRSPTLVALCLTVCAVCKAEAIPPSADQSDDRIRPYAANRTYWQYQGKPVLLLGGSKKDNLFQIPDLEEHLDLLASVGGNFIRNNMSGRRLKGYEVEPYLRLPDGRYSLDAWNDEYWSRFENLLRLTHARGIIVQIEVWDRFDYADSHSIKHWQESPYRPNNNINYSGEETGLADRYPDHPWRDRQPFFHTVPGMEKYREEYDLLREYQERFVAKMLSYSLGYDNVIYCMNNETSTEPIWGQYWIAFIERAAAERGVDVFTTDMFDDIWRPEQSRKFQTVLRHPRMYTYVEVSQINSRNFGENHWRRLLWVMRRVKKHPRPVNNVKIYGDGDTSWGSGTPKDGVERFWRNIIAGSAAMRFHRDGAGTGLQPISQASLKAARLAEARVKPWDVEPRNDLLTKRTHNEAYLAARVGHSYLLYFTDGGSVGLDLSREEGKFILQWIDIGKGTATDEHAFSAGRVISIAAPAKGGWVAAITRR